MAELKTKTLDAYDTDMKLLQNNWGGEFQKLKEKYFTLVNKKQEQEEKPRQIVISFGNWH